MNILRENSSQAPTQTKIFNQLRKKKQRLLHVCLVASVMSDSLRPQGLESARFLCPWDFPDKNAAMLSPGYFHSSRIEHTSLKSPELAGGFFNTETLKFFYFYQILFFISFFYIFSFIFMHAYINFIYILYYILAKSYIYSI